MTSYRGWNPEETRFSSTTTTKGRGFCLESVSERNCLHTGWNPGATSFNSGKVNKDLQTLRSCRWSAVPGGQQSEPVVLDAWHMCTAGEAMSEQ
eukprot:3583200-Amphidinium_carterae.1